MNKKQLLALILAGGLLYNPFTQRFDTLSCLASTISRNDEYDFTNEEFYNMMLTHKDQITDMLNYDNAYIARGGEDSYSFELNGFREWNEKDLTKMLELAANYLRNMQDNNFNAAQENGEALVKYVKDSIVELAFIAEDNKYKSLTEKLDNGSLTEVFEEEGKIIYSGADENGMINRYIYASVGNLNFAFNTLTAFDLSTYNRDGIIDLDKSPLDLIDSFLLTISEPIYNPTLYNQIAINITWEYFDNESVPAIECTEWFYDVGELQDICTNGFYKIKSDLGLDPDSYSIIVDNSINGFKIQDKDKTIEYIITYDQGLASPILTEICNIQGLSKATSPSNLETFDTSVDYSYSFKTVNAFLAGDPNFKVLELKKINN